MKIYFFIGTTAELIKLAPLMREFDKRRVNFKVITSGQTNVKFDELVFMIKKKKADITLSQKRNKSSIFVFLVWSLYTFFRTPILKKEFEGVNKKETYFIVHGDPVSSLIGAIIAKIYGLRLIHIESGLRSFNFLEPFPEEICRNIISKLADYHFCPNDWAMSNLKNVGGIKTNTYHNTLIESYYASLSVKASNELNIRKKKYFVLIVHRQEHVIFGKEKSKRIIENILKKVNKNLVCVFITHATTKSFLDSTGFKLTEEQKKRVVFVERLHYVNFLKLLENSEFLITDGGGNQEEAYYMGLPCLLLRNNTERTEGLNENVVLSKNKISTINLFLKNYKNYRRKKIKLDKKPSKIIANVILKNEISLN